MVTVGSVPKLWPGETFVCIGGGPSLTPADVDYCRGKARVIAVNDAYKLAPWADVLYACDAVWWKHWHTDAVHFPGLKYAISKVRQTMLWEGPEVVQVLRNTGQTGLELDPTGLRTGQNSGYQAMNLAVHLGAAAIILLGYDMHRHGGKDHWFGSHPTRQDSPFQDMVGHFTALAPILQKMGIAVVNCSPVTALSCFPCVPLAEALPARVEAVA